MLKAHLTLHSRMSGSLVSDHTIVVIWVMNIFFFSFYSSSVYSRHLFLISSASVEEEVKKEVAQSCLTLCDPMDCSLRGSLSMRFFRQEYWSGLPLGSYNFCPLLCPSLHEIVPWVSVIFLEKSLVFPILLFSPISLHWSLRKAFLSLLVILQNSAFTWISFLYSFSFSVSSFLSYL